MAVQQATVQFSGMCSAPAEAVFSLLADIGSHLEWGGTQQRGFFRLLSINGPEVPAVVGTEFTSTGSIPGSRFKFEDKSTVTRSVPASSFEFTTHSTVRQGPSKTMEAEYLHQYRIEPANSGCRVTYTFRQQWITNPMARLGIPVVRTATWKFGIPFMMKQGFDNLLRLAEKRVGEVSQRAAA